MKRGLLELALKSADEAEIYVRESKSTQLSCLNREVTAADVQDKQEIFLRLSSGGRIGSAVTTSFADEGVVKRAMDSLVPGDLALDLCGPSNAERVLCYDEKVASLSPQEMARAAEDIASLMHEYDSELKPEIQIFKEEGKVVIVNSADFDDEFLTTRYRVVVTTKNKLGFTEVNRRMQGASLLSFGKEQAEALWQLHRAGRQTADVASGRMPVIFSGKAMGALLWRLLAGVNSGNVLLGTSSLLGKLGKQVAAPHLTVRDWGTKPWGWGSRPFDDRGVPTGDTTLIKDGILRCYLASPSDADKLEVAPTGNSFKRTPFSNDIEDPYYIDATNLVLVGTTLEDKDLLQKAGRGIYVQSVMGAHTGNIVAGDYSLPISRGYVIEDGAIVGKLKDTIVSGNIYRDFHKIVALGTSKEPLEAIDHQYGDCPAVLFEDISVVGG